MHRRTRVLAVLALVAALLAAGCLNVQSEYAATPASVDNETLSETSYEASGSDRLTVVRENVPGAEGNVTVVSHVRSYAREGTLAGANRPIAGFVVLSTPSVQVTREEFNPVADQSLRDLFDRFRDRIRRQLDAGRLSNVRQVGQRNVTVLGNTTTARLFAADATVEGRSVTVEVPVVRVKDGSDFIVAAGVYPDQLSGTERERLRRLFAGITHEG